MEETAILSNFQRYGFTKPVVGTVYQATDFNAYRRVLSFGSNGWIEVEEVDLVYVDLSEEQVKELNL